MAGAGETGERQVLRAEMYAGHMEGMKKKLARDEALREQTRTLARIKMASLKAKRLVS